MGVSALVSLQVDNLILLEQAQLQAVGPLFYLLGKHRLLLSFAGLVRVFWLHEILEHGVVLEYLKSFVVVPLHVTQGLNERPQWHLV